jgi:uncharacterized protein YoxC
MPVFIVLLILAYLLTSMLFTPSRSSLHSLVTGRTKWTALQEQIDSLSATIDVLTRQFEGQTKETTKESNQFQSDINDATEKLRHIQAQLTSSMKQTSGSVPVVETVRHSLSSLQKKVSSPFFSFASVSTTL